MEEETTELEINNSQAPAREGQITVSEAGRLGGNATLRNQGADFFKDIGRKGGKRTAKLYGHLMREYGQRGGRPKRPALH
jgi:general stress protein YciG